jgi:hypothetical protein
MGYTHYWKSENKAASITKATQKSLLAVCEHGVAAGILYNQITIDKNVVWFEGEGENGYETFGVRLVDSLGATGFDFCKTGRRPYDRYVVACLMILEANVKGFSWSSGGDEEDFQEAKELLASLKILNFLDE